ncbi:hypothetical protein Tco_0784323 [Tanacetum coccineum]
MSNSSSMLRGFQPKFTLKFIQSTQHAQRSQGEPKVQKDYKAEYKKMKAKLALLEANPPTPQSSKPFQSKNKGLGAEMFDWDEEIVFDNEDETRVQVLMALADDELSVRKNHTRNGEWIDTTMKKVNILLSMDEDSDWQNYLKFINIDLKVSSDPESSKESGSEPQTPLPPLKNLQRAFPSSEVMTLTYQDYCPRERSGLGTMKHIKPETQEYSNKNVSRPVTVPNPKPVTSSVPTEVKKDDQESKINELTKLILKSKAKPYPPWTPYGFNDYHPDDCRNYLECKIYGSYDHFTSEHNRVIQVIGGVLAESSQSSESSIYVSGTTFGSSVHSTSDHNDFEHFKRDEKLQATKAKEPTKNGCSRCMISVKSYLHKYVEQPSPKVAFVNGLKYNLISISQLCDAKYIIQFDNKQGTIFNANKEITLISLRRNEVYVLDTSSLTPNGACFLPKLQKRFTNTSVDKIRIDDSSRYPPDEYLHEDDPSRQYQSNSDISYYIIPHGHSLTKLNQNIHIPELITQNEQNIPHTKDVEGPPNQESTKGIQEHVVQNEQINDQSTKETSGNNTETSVPITKILVP